MIGRRSVIADKSLDSRCIQLSDYNFIPVHVAKRHTEEYEQFHSAKFTLRFQLFLNNTGTIKDDPYIYSS